MKRNLLTLFVILSSLTTRAQMSGVYSVGGTNPDFNSIGEACASINASGVSGPVIISIRDGIYYDSIYLTSISGSSEINTVTFQSESLNQSNVEIHYGNIFPVRLIGSSVDYVSLKYLTITSDSDFGVVYCTGGVDHLTISDCTFNGAPGPLTANQSSIIFCENTGEDNMYLTLTNSELNNGSYGLLSENDLSNASDFIINNNVFYENYQYVIDIARIKTFELKNNIITSTTSQAFAATIQLYEVINSFEISGNEIYRIGPEFSDGIRILYCQASGVIANNILSIPGANVDGIFIESQTSNIDIINNTVRVGGTPINLSNNGGGTDIFNNALISTGGNFIYDITGNNFASIPTSDFNAYFTSGDFGDIDSPFNLTFSNQADYTAFTGNDVNSFQLTDFGFIDDTSDLHSCNDSLIGSGVLWSGINSDIDGEIRGLPSVGADYHAVSGSIWNNDTLGTCVGVPIVLDAGVADSYLWSTQETTQAINANNFGEYSVEWTGTCGSYFDTVYVQDITPIANFSVDQSFLTFAFTNNSVNGLNYAWDFGDGTSSSELNPVHIYNDLNSHVVILTVSNSCGSDVASMQITPSIVELNEGGESLDFALFPNPANDKISIVFPSEIHDVKNVIISDMRGAIVRTVEIYEQSTTIDISDLKAGSYFLAVQSSDLKKERLIIKL